MTRAQEMIAVIGGILGVVTVVGGFGVGLMRRWWSLEQWIKTSVEQDRQFKKSDRKLKRQLRGLVEQTLAEHSGFDARFEQIEKRVDALQNGTTWRELRRRQRGNRT